MTLSDELTDKLLKQLPVQISAAVRRRITTGQNRGVKGADVPDRYRSLLEAEGLGAPPTTQGPAVPPGAQSKRHDFLSRFAMLYADLTPHLLPLTSAAKAQPAPTEEILKLIEAYRQAVKTDDRKLIEQIRGGLSDRQNAGLDSYYSSVHDLEVVFEERKVWPIDDHRYAVSYLRRDNFVDNASNEKVTLELRIIGSAVRTGDTWILTNEPPK